MNSGKIVAGRVDGWTGRNIEGSTRGPRGPKNCTFLSGWLPLWRTFFTMWINLGIGVKSHALGCKLYILVCENYFPIEIVLCVLWGSSFRKELAEDWKLFYFFAFEFFRAFRNKLNLLPLCDATAEKHEISYSIYNPIKLKFAQKWNNFDQFYSLMHSSHCLPCPPINFGNSSFDTDISRVFIGYKYSGISKAPFLQLIENCNAKKSLEFSEYSKAASGLW